MNSLTGLSLLANLPEAPPATLEVAVLRARETLLSEDADGAALRKALEGLLLWVDAVPNPTEREVITSSGLNADDLVVLTGTALEAGGSVARTPQGDMILQNFHIAIPLAAVHYSRVLDAHGQPTPPFAGALPFITFRWLAPRKCFRQQDVQ